jgi:hypothetical protein
MKAQATFLIAAAAWIVLQSTGIAEPPSGKAGKRAGEIEASFGVVFVNVIQISSDKKIKPFWSFLKKEEKAPFGGLAFAVPVNATDSQVENGIASALTCAIFYRAIIEKVMPGPTPASISYTEPAEENVPWAMVIEQ